MVGKEVQEGRAEIILPEYRAHPTNAAEEIYAVYPAGRMLSAKVRAYIDFAADKFRTEPDFRICALAPSAAA